MKRKDMPYGDFPAFERESGLNYQSELSAYASALGLKLSAQQCENLEKFADFLLAYNENVNLVGSSDKSVLVSRHILDALTILQSVQKFAPQAKRYIDIGSGGGLPGMLVALASDLDVTLMDSIAKKCHFLEEAARRFNLTDRVSVHVGRAEEFAHDKNFRQKFDVGTARAVGSLKITAELVAPFLKRGGLFLAQKTAKREQAELQEAEVILDSLSLKMSQRISYREFKSIEENIILVYEKTAETDKRYPRSWKLISAESLKSS